MKKRLGVRVLGIKKQVPTTEESIQVLRKYAYSLGLSLDKAGEALLCIGMEMDRDDDDIDKRRLILAKLPEAIHPLDAAPIGPMDFALNLETSRVSGTRAQMQLSINMALTQYSVDNDPISITLKYVSEACCISVADFLKDIYLKFLRANDFISDGSSLTEEDVMNILQTREFKPYGWSYNPWLDLDKLKAKQICYSFLSPGDFPHSNRVTLNWKKKSDTLIFESLHIICKVLYRDASSFFQMLYMHFLWEHDLLDEDFHLKKDWKIILSKAMNGEEN